MQLSGLQYMTMSKLIGLLIITTVMMSCGPKTIFKDSKEVAENGWVKKNPLTFNFDIEDTSGKYDIILTVNYKEDFRFTNQYVKVLTTFPDKKNIEDIVSLELSKSNGTSNGKCSGSECQVPILFQENINFPQSGHYTIHIGQYSRLDTIVGMQSMELKIVEHPAK